MTTNGPLVTPVTAAATIGVLIPSHNRPKHLERCLRALAEQQRRPDDVLVVVRDSDAATHLFLDAFDAAALGLPLCTITVRAPGVVAARNAGLAVCRTAILAMIDDDTAPHPDWLVRIAERFAADPMLGGLGGRDRCHDGERFDEAKAAVVGRIRCWGRLVGNHHRGFGAIRDVDFLKGANMSYRVAALADMRFDTRLRGNGAGPHEDMALSIGVRRNGWRIAYDPDVMVDHFAAPRAEPRHYVTVGRLADHTSFCNHAFNIVVAIWEDLSPSRRLAFMVWSLLIGTRTCPGLAQAFRFTPRLGLDSWRRFFVAQRALGDAYAMLGVRPRSGSRAVVPHRVHYGESGR